LLRIRKASRDNLPFGHSNIPFDILVVVSYYENLGQKLTVKNLFANLNYSETGLRLHFRRLINKGWLKLEIDISDKRSKVVAVTDKFRDVFDKFADQCNL
jgi:DNA-binding MarR family transcriptional regulator